MQKIYTKLPEIRLVGISTRTSNAAEMDKATAKIGLTMQRFFTEDIQGKILNIKSPERIFAVYTAYESDASGAYTYFIGKEVSSFESLATPLETLIIPEQDYVRFTNDPGPMPAVCIQMWQTIWQLSPADLGGQRAYVADFEVYDARSQDPKSTVLDIYIGLHRSKNSV